MSAAAGISLMDFVANDLPSKKWMRCLCPRVRLRVRVQNRDFVSSPVKIGGRSSDETVSGVSWPWHDFDGQFSRPYLADDEVFEVEVERRYVLWYRCIRRTKPATIDQVRTGHHCALSLYDGEQFGEVSDERIDIGDITFAIHDDVSSSQGKTSLSTYS